MKYYIKRNSFLSELGTFTGAFMGAFVASRENQMALYAEAKAIDEALRQAEESQEKKEVHVPNHADVEANALIVEIMGTNFSGIAEPELHEMRKRVSNFLNSCPEYRGIHRPSLYLFETLAENKDVISLGRMVQQIKASVKAWKEKEAQKRDDEEGGW